VSDALGCSLISMDDFRSRGVGRTKYFTQHNGEKIRNYEHPDLWDGLAITHKLRAFIRDGLGFVAEGNHLLHYPGIAELAQHWEIVYLAVDHATSVVRRKTRHRYSPADESFIRNGALQTALWVEPQKFLPRVRIIDGTFALDVIASLILRHEAHVVA